MPSQAFVTTEEACIDMTSPAVIFEARSITRRYPGTIALDRVDFRVYRDQVNVLIGENGAGKSTLMRILAGVEQPDEGQLLLDGGEIVLRSPRDATRNGIAIVHQELSVLPNLDLADNIFAGRELSRVGILVNRTLEEQRSFEVLRLLRSPMDVRTPAGHLSLGCRQIVELARALEQRAKILILDEPTSALSNAEAESLFAVIGELKRAGVTIIYISHRLNELLHLGDHFTVLRSGRVVGESTRAKVDRRWIVERMSGRDISKVEDLGAMPFDGTTLLNVSGLTVASTGDSEANVVPLRDVSFSLRKQEVLGIYGLLGAGRTELLGALAGERPIRAGTIQLSDRDVRVNSVAEAVKAGIHLVPEDRQRDALVPELSVRENIALAGGGAALLDRKKEASSAWRLVKDLNIRVSDLELPITALSGGNQQKVIIARCLMCSPTLLLLDEPTRGVDVCAKAEIYTILRRLASHGIGIIFTSSEIEEMQALADRALVLCQGRITAILDRKELTDEALFVAASPVVAAASTTRSGSVSL
ncbi:MAG TPA: sugar ABC transporter ATP-binding protein [Nitrospira sp.]|nr:sugar ABC transporter ATP-binding protein [Nitrospira sp.]